MPEGTKVHRCVEKVKAKGGNVNPYAVCQSSTGQSYATGKSKTKEGKSVGSKNEDTSFNGKLHRALQLLQEEGDGSPQTDDLQEELYELSERLQLVKAHWGDESWSPEERGDWTTPGSPAFLEEFDGYVTYTAAPEDIARIKLILDQLGGDPRHHLESIDYDFEEHANAPKGLHVEKWEAEYPAPNQIKFNVMEIDDSDIEHEPPEPDYDYYRGGRGYYDYGDY